MEERFLDIKTVAVIGAGVSGVAAAIHLKRAGLDVTVYDRNARAGGIWIYDQRVAKDGDYPAETPSVGDSPEYQKLSKRFKFGLRHDSPMRELDTEEDCNSAREDDIRTSFAPPGPCYIALKNNVSTIEMEMTCQAWKVGTAEFVTHNIIADYIQDSAVANSVVDSISFNTRVNHVRKVDATWEVNIAQLVDDPYFSIVESVRHFDAVVICSGHYHAVNTPDIPGLSHWKRQFPTSVRHSKLYRFPKSFRGQNILLIGAGVSSMDIARDLGTVARSVYQSSRGGPYDLPSHLLPENGARVGPIRSFDTPASSELNENRSIPATVTLQSGRKLCGIHHVIVCTGYHVSFPFMRQYHADGVAAKDADEEIIVTNGQQTHNLHKDIWYIPDPTLAFIGVPYHVATFTLFEFQAIALAAVFSGRAKLPSRESMWVEYAERLKRKGAGRNFHSLKKRGEEIGYVNELVDLVNAGDRKPELALKGHSEKWHEAYVRRGKRVEALFSAVRDPSLDIKVLDLIEGC